MSKFRNFCFTDFILDGDFWENIDCEYLIYGLETCPSTTKEHWQGFIRFKNQRSFKAVIKALKPRHVEICKGSADDNIKYCSKDSNVVCERGTRPSQGARSDLAEIHERIKDGVSVDTITEENPMMYHQYGRTLNKLEDLQLRRKFRSWMTEGIWYYGPTGSGKSHEAFKDYSPDTHYVLPDDKGWWDGYTGQETVIINDFRGSLTYGFLLQLVDKWPVNVSRRQREPVPFLAKRLIITSSLHPTEIYCNLSANDSLGQLYRRFQIQELAQKCSEGNTETSEPEKDFVICKCCNPLMCSCQLKYEQDRLDDHCRAV